MKIKTIAACGLAVVVGIVGGAGAITYFVYPSISERQADASREVQDLIEESKKAREDFEQADKSSPEWKELSSGSPIIPGNIRVGSLAVITNIDCSQINRVYADRNRPIAYMGGVPLNGVLQPNSEIHRRINEACRKAGH